MAYDALGCQRSFEIQMKIEILLATMFFEKEQESLLASMNPQCDLVVGNQSDYNLNESFLYNGHNVTVLTRPDRGVGRNRNLSLNHANADIILFADSTSYFYTKILKYKIS